MIVYQLLQLTKIFFDSFSRDFFHIKTRFRRSRWWIRWCAGHGSFHDSFIAWRRTWCGVFFDILIPPWIIDHESLCMISQVKGKNLPISSRASSATSSTGDWTLSLWISSSKNDKNDICYILVNIPSLSESEWYGRLLGGALAPVVIIRGACCCGIE